MNSTTWLKQVKRTLAIESLGLLPAVSGFAHGEDAATTDWNGFMDGWTHWDMVGGWMWVFPALTIVFLTIVSVTLMKANRTPMASTAITQNDRGAKKE